MTRDEKASKEKVIQAQVRHAEALAEAHNLKDREYQLLSALAKTTHVARHLEEKLQRLTQSRADRNRKPIPRTESLWPRAEVTAAAPKHVKLAA